MLANATRLLSTASFYLVFVSLITGCQTAPPQNDSFQFTPPAIDTSRQTSSVAQALQQLNLQQFAAAETDFQALLKESTDQNTIQESLAGLTLVYLHPNSPMFNLALATATMDRLYQQMMRWPQNKPSLDMFLLSAKLCLEQRLDLNREIALREKAEAKQQQLLNETFNLQRAIEKLRQLTLQ
ncbi:hypothetical protein [Zhongshania sp.]|mgnify:FL=1|uniref:hypothetical protein n=1 Tax=Zhongshania sp. TaxID=1971902 RepID=UPI001B7B0436|nr:hypothetical protein [Zhongshania sp.]MBQ0796181.1 hypothetical protein [Zhongshania sp.]|tara:strand:- start:1262 stop:1810 length:549 start_codon:yes stop_codon:yes gene_type:complete